MPDDVDTLFALGLGPWLTRLRGKIPCSESWTTLPPVDEPTVENLNDLWVRTNPTSSSRARLRTWSWRFQWS